MRFDGAIPSNFMIPDAIKKKAKITTAEQDFFDIFHSFKVGRAPKTLRLQGSSRS